MIFANSENKEFLKKYLSAAMRDLEVGNTTLDVIEDSNPQRRQDLVNTIISKAKIDNKDKIDVLEQSITLPRISLMPENNFDEFQLYNSCKMWEEMIIILTTLSNRNNKH